jgi:phosphatidylinositol glycan class T
MRVLSLALLSLFSAGASFYEELLLRPLEDSKVLAHFQFDMEASAGPHFTLFPKSLGQILERYHRCTCARSFLLEIENSLRSWSCRFKVSELHLSLTQGRWRHNHWGHMLPGVNVTSALGETIEVAPLGGPVGGELVAWLDEVDDDKVDALWINLQQALAGVFCASLHQIGGMQTSRPRFAFQQAAGADTGRNRVRYGTLPRENVCTENLTPWLKLLPCRNQAGLGKLLNSYKLFESFHSLRVDVLPVMTAGVRTGWKLRQSIDVVLDARSAMTESPDWSTNTLFGVKTMAACPVASHSAVLVQVRLVSLIWEETKSSNLILIFRLCLG